MTEAKPSKTTAIKTPSGQNVRINEVDADTLSVSEFKLPASEFVDKQSRMAIVEYMQQVAEQADQTAESSPTTPTTEEEWEQFRTCQAEQFYQSSNYTNMKRRYPVTVQPDTFSGVNVEVFTPIAGVPERNRDFILINAHGGAFQYGSRTFSHLESIPIAVVGQVKVVSVDYRLAPLYQFPAGSDDLLAVYKNLLKKYEPSCIGIYGCSAGALLIAQAIAQLLREGEPVPGALGMSCGGAYYWHQGDSGFIGNALRATSVPTVEDNPYFEGLTVDHAFAFPGNNPDRLRGFPPSILISSSRDFAMSSVTQTHGQLVKAGVAAQLHIFDGLKHGFHYNSELPQSEDTFDLITQFFKKYLRQS